MAKEGAYERPRWMRDLLRFLPLKAQFVLSGNVRDLQLVELTPGIVAAQPLTTALSTELKRHGYGHVVAYDPVAGFRVLDGSGGASGESAGS